jgi:quercetin dioxygenase-like cupin family protein
MILATLFLLLAAADTVTYVPAKDVTAATVKTPTAAFITTENYSVMANKRTGGGQSELHDKDTDVFYVIDGSATFITGGTMVEGKSTAPGETRGTSINGGQTHHLSKGDVITIPKGVPHWFKAVDGSVVYVVVKVR